MRFLVELFHTRGLEDQHCYCCMISTHFGTVGALNLSANPFGVHVADFSLPHDFGLSKVIGIHDIAMKLKKDRERNPMVANSHLGSHL